MRTIAVASVVLVAVTAGLSQKAHEAPRPPGARRKSGGISQIACASTKSCAALGEWLYTDTAGTWKATFSPRLPQAGSASLLSLACPASGRCEAVGVAGVQYAVHASESGAHWQIGAVDLPSDAAPVDSPVGLSAALLSVSCAAAGDCVAAGSYFGADRLFHPLLDTEDAGTWGAGSEPQLPANADTSPDPNQPGHGGILTLVECPAAGNCTAVGRYTNKDEGHSYYPWVASETDGTWSPGSEALLPTDAKAIGDIKPGQSPFFGFTGLSCPSVGNCTAVGGYEDTNDGWEGLILTEHNGVWSRGVRAPLPPRAVPNTESNEDITPITSLSCAAPGDCAAVGWYVFHRLAKPHGWLLRERNGKWKASALVVPATAKESDAVILNKVDCLARGNCIAVGEYYPVPGQSESRGLIVRERSGTWTRAVNAALPKNAATATGARTQLYSISCPSARQCTVVGTYKDRSSRPQGLLLHLRLR